MWFGFLMDSVLESEIAGPSSTTGDFTDWTVGVREVNMDSLTQNYPQICHNKLGA